MLDTEHVKHKPSVCLYLLWLPNCVITWSLVALARLASIVLTTLHDSCKPSVVCLWDFNCHCNLQMVFINKN